MHRLTVVDVDDSDVVASGSNLDGHERLLAASSARIQDISGSSKCKAARRIEGIE